MYSGTGVVVAAVPASFSLTPRKNSGLDGRGHWQAAVLGRIEVVNQHEPRPVPLFARELELQERVGPEGQHTTRTASAAKSWRSRVNRTPLDGAEGVAFGHGQRLEGALFRLKPSCSDRTLGAPFQPLPPCDATEAVK